MVDDVYYSDDDPYIFLNKIEAYVVYSIDIYCGKVKFK